MENNKPIALRILGVLSLIGSSLGCLYGLEMSSVGQLSHEEFASAMQTSALAKQFIEQDPSIIERALALCSIGVYYSLFNALAIFGDALMLTGRRTGLHLYAAAQIGQAGIFCIAQGVEFSLTYILWNALWVFLFYKASRHLKEITLDNN